jgi:glutamyl-tRNA reductase
MDRVAVMGLSLHHTEVEGLERLARGLAQGAEALEKRLADALGASEVVCLATCNRLEVLFARESGHPPGPEDCARLCEEARLVPDDPLRARIFLHTGARAARHVFRVAASLDSLLVGEGEILAQVRAAWGRARELGLGGPLLSPLLEQALLLGKEARTHTDLARHPISVVSLAVAFLSERLRGRAAPRVAVIGAGATGTHAARALRAAGLGPTWIANRTAARAQALASEVGAEAVPLEVLQRAELAADALVSATGAPGLVLEARALEAMAARTPSGGTLVVADLAVPRDLAPETSARIERIDLEALRAAGEHNRARRAAAAAEVEVRVEERLATLRRERTGARLRGPYAHILSEARETFELELARLAQGRLAHIPEPERRAVERWARATFARLAHVPLAALKRLGQAEAGQELDWEGFE